jgi:hypothetical protein
MLTSDKAGQVEKDRDRVFVGRERHANVRAGQIGYPARAIRTAQYLYIVNLTPDRWPAGDPEELPQSPQGTYGDIDAGPAKTWMIENRDSSAVAELWKGAFEKRPAEELYDLTKDPEELRNVIDEPACQDTRKQLAASLRSWRETMKDPNLTGDGSRFDRYPYYGKRGR